MPTELHCEVVGADGLLCFALEDPDEGLFFEVVVVIGDGLCLSSTLLICLLHLFLDPFDVVEPEALVEALD